MTLRMAATACWWPGGALVPILTGMCSLAQNVWVQVGAFKMVFTPPNWGIIPILGFQSGRFFVKVTQIFFSKFPKKVDNS